MPRYISKLGVWEPAKERVVLPNAEPGKEIYEGEDRAALWEMQKAGHIDEKGNKIGNFGVYFKNDPEFFQMVRSRGYNSIDEYLKAMGFDEEKVKAQYDDHKKAVTRHEAPKRKKGTKFVGGGENRANPKSSKIGDFGDPPELGG